MATIDSTSTNFFNLPSDQWQAVLDYTPKNAVTELLNHMSDERLSENAIDMKIQETVNMCLAAQQTQLS